MATQSPALAYSATRLRELLDAQGRRNKWLAERTGNTESTVARYLTGAWPVSETFAVKAAQALGVPAHWLAEDREAAGV